MYSTTLHFVDHGERWGEKEREKGRERGGEEGREGGRERVYTENYEKLRQRKSMKTNME